MKTNQFFYILFILPFFITAQTKTVNDYEYVIVPEKFDFLKSPDKYQVNALTDFLFKKNGFNSIYQSPLPENVKQNPCTALKADVEDNSGLFVTKLKVVLRDCHDQIIFSTKEGRSRSKDYKTAYHESLRDAFTEITALGYQYNGTQQAVTLAQAEPEKEVVKTMPKSENLPKGEAVVASTIAAPKVSAETKDIEENSDELVKSYSNENISFFIMTQGDKKIALVNKSQSNTYKKGEQIAIFTKTSLPNVYRVNWKNTQGQMVKTTGYFDEKGNLNVDIEKDGKIEVKTFKLEN